MKKCHKEVATQPLFVYNRDNNNFIMATHASRDTTTGNKKELELEVFLNENYSGNVYPQAIVGKQFTTNKDHIVDILIGGDAYKKTKKAKRWTSNHKGGKLVSLKRQGVGGTAEEKIDFECNKLQDAIDKYGYECGIIVLCGHGGWTLKEYFLSDNFKHSDSPDVTIITEETFRGQYK